MHAMKRGWFVLIAMVVLSSAIGAKEPKAIAASAPPLEVANAQVAEQPVAVPIASVITSISFTNLASPSKIVGPEMPKAAFVDINMMLVQATAEDDVRVAQAAIEQEAAVEQQAALERFLASLVKPKPAPASVSRQVVVAESGESGVSTPDQWAALRKCESGGNYAIDTGNSFYGAYQFTLGTWRTNAPEGWEEVRPSEAPAEIQDQAAQTLYSRRGRQPWPVCGRFLP